MQNYRNRLTFLSHHQCDRRAEGGGADVYRPMFIEVGVLSTVSRYLSVGWQIDVRVEWTPSTVMQDTS